MGRDQFAAHQPAALVQVAYSSHHCMSVELDVGDFQGGALFKWNVVDGSFDVGSMVVIEPGERTVPPDAEAAAAGIDDPVDHAAAVLMARYGGPADATAEAIRRLPPRR
jgi:hypothetical protein